MKASRGIAFRVWFRGAALYPDQSFEVLPGFTCAYNVYLNNSGYVSDTFNLKGVSSQGWGFRLYLETDYSDGGDTLLAEDYDGDGVWDYVNPAYDSDGDGNPDLSLGPGEVACLIFERVVPGDAAVCTTDDTVLVAWSDTSLTVDRATLSTHVGSPFWYPSTVDWVQLGSDDVNDTAPTIIPEADDKAVYTVNDGYTVYFRLAEAAEPDVGTYEYRVYLDTTDGGDPAHYDADYYLSSDGTLYAWDGTTWVPAGSTVVYTIGTSVVLGTDLASLTITNEYVGVYAETLLDGTVVDSKGPFYVVNQVIYDVPPVVLPALVLAIVATCAYVARRKRGG